MTVRDLLTDLGYAIKLEYGQFLIDCPECNKAMHVHVDESSGIFHCIICGWKGNPVILVRHNHPDFTKKEIMQLLNTFNLADGKAPDKPKEPRSLSWLRDKLRKPTPEEINTLCKTKSVDADALAIMKPLMHKVDPIMYLPGTVPGNPRIISVLRVHLHGELIQTKHGPEKYPILGTWALLGLEAAEEAETIIFAEGWGDALLAIKACMELGKYPQVTAIAHTGGTGWKDAWLPLFKGKRVIVVPDADIDGVKSAKMRCEKIEPVATEVRLVELPYAVEKKHGKDLKDYLL